MTQAMADLSHHTLVQDLLAEECKFISPLKGVQHYLKSCYLYCHVLKCIGYRF